jgi:hypothetical protein
VGWGGGFESRQARRKGVAFAVLAVVAVVSAACSGGSRTAHSFRVDAVAGSPARSTTPSALVRGVLSPGRYYTTRFRPRLLFTVPAGWSLFDEGTSSLGFRHPDPHLVVYVLRRSALRRPANPWFVGNEVQQSLKGATQFPGSVVDLARSYPGVSIQDAGEVTILGRPTAVTSVRYQNPAAMPGQCTAIAPCPQLVTVDPSSGVFGLYAGEEQLFAELQRSDLLVLAYLTQPASGDPLAVGRSLIESMRRP